MSLVYNLLQNIIFACQEFATSQGLQAPLKLVDDLIRREHTLGYLLPSSMQKQHKDTDFRSPLYSSNVT
jgi:hypothetical protein